MGIDIDANLALTDDVRARAIHHLSKDETALHAALADPKTASILIKLLDGKDRQALNLQKNQIDSQMADAMGTLADAAEQVIDQLGGVFAIRTVNPEPNPSATTSIERQYTFVPDEATLEPSEELTFDTFAQKRITNA